MHATCIANLSLGHFASTRYKHLRFSQLAAFYRCSVIDIKMRSSVQNFGFLPAAQQGYSPRA
jgi:hypothetical protein